MSKLTQTQTDEALILVMQKDAARIAELEAQRDTLLTICEELAESADYWSEYDVPLGIVERLNAAIARVKNHCEESLDMVASVNDHFRDATKMIEESK